MLIEFIKSKLTSADKMVRTIGFVNSSIALEARAKRCAKAWKPHLDHCHRVILKYLPQDAKRILIIGSGPLLEIPIQELLKRDLKIALMDVVHPLKTRKLAAKHPDKIELIENDATGIVEVIKAKDYDTVRDLKFRPHKLDLGKFDYVVSANLISQLPLDPYDAVKRFKWADDAFFSRMAHEMGERHIEWIQAFGAPKTLVIADVGRTYYDKAGQEIDKSVSAYRLNQGKLVEEWDWEISPLGETSRKFCYIMQVETRIF